MSWLTIGPEPTSSDELLDTRCAYAWLARMALHTAQNTALITHRSDGCCSASAQRVACLCLMRVGMSMGCLVNPVSPGCHLARVGALQPAHLVHYSAAGHIADPSAGSLSVLLLRRCRATPTRNSRPSSILGGPPSDSTKGVGRRQQAHDLQENMERYYAKHRVAQLTEVQRGALLAQLAAPPAGKRKKGRA